MSIIRIIKKLLGGTIGAWLNNEKDRAFRAAVDKVASKYGAQAASFVQEVGQLSLSNPDKLFAVAGKLVALVAKDGPQLPLSIAVAVAQAAYNQVKTDAFTEVRAFLAVA